METDPTHKVLVKKRSVKKWVITILVILYVIASLGALWWQWDQAAKQQSASEKKIEELEEEVKELKKASKEGSASEDTATESKSTSDALLENIEDAVKSKNYAALEQNMAKSVNVVLAASEAYGPQTPAQAVGDLAFLDDATEPWNFDLSDTVLASYQGGSYIQYFPEDALVGRSENKYVVSFTFDEDGNISSIFMTGNEALLLP